MPVVRAQPKDGAIEVGDIATYEGWPSLLTDVDAIVHLAARAHVLRETAPDPLAEFRRVNTAAVTGLATAAAAVGVGRFVFLSSIGVNGVRTQDHAFSESDEPNPTEPYAISKWEAEQGLMEIGARTRMGITRVRSPLIVGPGAKGNLRRLMKLVHSGIPLPFGAVRNRRSFIALHDLCELLVLCVVNQRAGGELFLVADDEDISTPELLRKMAKSLGHASRVFPMPLPVLRLAVRVAGAEAEFERMASSLQVNGRHAREVLGWKASVGIHEGIRSMARAYLAELEP